MARYQQIGPDIDDEAANDYFFGYLVSTSGDGTTFVVGTTYSNCDSGTRFGSVQVYKFNSTTNRYVKVGTDIYGEADYDTFGWSVSMSGDGATFVVGASNNDGINGTASGHVRVYKFNSTFNSYTQMGLDIDGEAAGDGFGNKVSMSTDGTTFAVSAPFQNGINGSFYGHIRIYKFDSTVNTFSQVGLDIDGKAANDFFGRSVSISGDGTTFVASAFVAGDTDHVRVYKLNSTMNTYVQVGLDIDGEDNGEFDGNRAVSISGDGATFVVGAPDAGRVRVYKFDTASNMYAQIGMDIDGEAAFNYFGRSVSMSADGLTFVVGAPFNNARGERSGQVRVYQFDSATDTYAQVGMDIDGKAPFDLFGNSVSMSANGTTFVVGGDNVRVFSTSIVRLENCGLLGWNLFCPRRGKCGLLRRLLNLGNCN